MMDSKNRVVSDRKYHYNASELVIFLALRCTHADANG
jgi:hypothetical protein